MIELYQAFVLALLQGLTEFLPISSSAHLVIPTLVFGWPDQGLAFDVAVHVGTLGAVVVYYRRDLLAMAYAWVGSLTGRAATAESRMVWYLGLATIPAGLVGLFGAGFIEQELRTLPVIVGTTGGFGILLGVADRRARDASTGRRLDLPVAILIGLAQAFAPVPGVSRSGVTITAALMLGMTRMDAARFSFLLSIPIIASAGVLKITELVTTQGAVDWLALCVGVSVSGLSAYLCIAAFMRFLDSVGLMPFVYYRIILAAFLMGVYLM